MNVFRAGGLNMNWAHVILDTGIFKSWKQRTVIRKYFYSKRGYKKSYQNFQFLPWVVESWGVVTTTYGKKDPD